MSGATLQANLNPEAIDSAGILARIKTTVKPDMVNLLRLYVQDMPEKNDLTDNEQEYTDLEVRLAILKSFDEINSIAPINIQLAVPGRAIPLDFFLNFGAIALLEMSIHRRLRNEVSYSDSGVSIDSTKFEKYLGLMERIRGFYTPKVAKYKMSVNMAAVSGLQPSGYLYEYLVI